MKTKITLIGKTTGGNHTATHPYINELYPSCILHIVDCMIFNSEEGNIPPAGFQPGKTVTEKTPAAVEPFGSKDDLYIAAALELIEPTGIEEPEQGSGSRSIALGNTPGHCSLDKKQSRGTSIR